MRSVATQVASVGCGQGIALVPAALRRIAHESVVFKPLAEAVDVVTTAAAWCPKSGNPALASALALLKPARDTPRRRRSIRV